MATDSGVHKSSCRQTRIKVQHKLCIFDRHLRNFVPVPCPGTALTAVEQARLGAAQAAAEQILPGAPQAAIDQTSPSTAKAALEQKHLERQNKLLGQTRSDAAQYAVEQKNRNLQRKLRLL